MRTFKIDNDIILKEIMPADAEDLFYTIDHERAHLRQWLSFIDDTRSVNDSLAYINSVLNPIDGSPKELVTVIYYNGQFAGLIGFKDTEEHNRCTEIGYWLSEKFQGHGIVTRSAKRLLAYAFNEQHMHRVQMIIAMNNFKSRRVAERLGFTQEGIQRDGELLPQGFTDLAVYSLLEKDYRMLVEQEVKQPASVN